MQNINLMKAADAIAKIKQGIINNDIKIVQEGYLDLTGEEIQSDTKTRSKKPKTTSKVDTTDVRFISQKDINISPAEEELSKLLTKKVKPKNNKEYRKSSKTYKCAGCGKSMGFSEISKSSYGEGATEYFCGKCVK